LTIAVNPCHALAPRKKESTARSEAIVQLERIDSGGAYPSLLRAPVSFDVRERRQLTDLVSGVTRLRRRLDFVLEQFVDRRLDRLDPPLLQILRLALYEMTERSRPPHAVVNEYVSLAGSTVRKQACALVNAVLRRVSERIADLPKPEMPDVAERLGIQYSHPTWMVRRWLDRYGEIEVRDLLNWDHSPPVFSARITILRADPAALIAGLREAGTDFVKSDVLDDFLRLDSIQPLVQLGWLREGLVQVQDESAGLVVRALDPQPGETVVDACAAPGGKLVYSCARMSNRGILLAVDSNAGRLRLAETTARKAGCSIVEFVHADAADLPQTLLNIQADRVLVDAPCSGLGVLSKRADLRWRRTATDIMELAGLQDRILESVARLVRPGGLLVYSTCTIEPEENEHRVTAFLERHDDFAVDSVAPFVPAEMVTAGGFFASLPQRHSVDGAFAARLVRSART
jgi:16S rRNA (cytosine967-C5)-methyltransferase